MEIGPIAGVRVMPIDKARPVDAELTAPFCIESTAGAENDNPPSTDEEAAGAEGSQDDLEEEGQGANEDLGMEGAFDNSRINIFA